MYHTPALTMGTDHLSTGSYKHNAPKYNEAKTRAKTAPNDAGDPIRPTPLTSKLALKYRKDNVLCKIKKIYKKNESNAS